LASGFTLGLAACSELRALGVRPQELCRTAAVGHVNHPPAPNLDEQSSSDEKDWKEATGGWTLSGGEALREGEQMSRESILQNERPFSSG